MKTLLVSISLISAVLLASKSAELPSEPQKDLLFKVYSTKYEDWHSQAFAPDKNRRKKFCDESQTMVGKASANIGLVVLRSFKTDQMEQFGSDELMISMAQKLNISHEVFELTPFTKEAKVKNPKSTDLLFEVNFKNFEDWKTKAFDLDSKRRWTFCNEYRTEVAKISNTKALVVLYQFDVTRFDDFTNMTLVKEYDFKKLEKELGIEHGPVYVMERM